LIDYLVKLLLRTRSTFSKSLWWCSWVYPSLGKQTWYSLILGQ